MGGERSGVEELRGLVGDEGMRGWQTVRLGGLLMSCIVVWVEININKLSVDTELMFVNIDREFHLQPVLP